jgi:hypothetical protein
MRLKRPLNDQADDPVKALLRNLDQGSLTALQRMTSLGHSTGLRFTRTISDLP